MRAAAGRGGRAGYLTGVTDTAAWTRYSAGQRDFGGIVLPGGMRKNQKLPQPIFDPTTKEATHDRTLSPEQMIAEGFITRGPVRSRQSARRSRCLRAARNWRRATG